MNRKNNFDFLRFIAAISVIFTHAFQLTLPENKNGDFLWIFTGGQLSIGGIAVGIFFVMSGYLITSSWQSKPDIRSYLRARSLRIFPGLIVLIFLTVFIIGPLFSKSDTYWQNSDTYRYLGNITLNLPKMSSTITHDGIQQSLPGVFENNSLPYYTNGSLWTLHYEFFAYLFIMVLGIFKLLEKRFVLFALGFFVVAHLTNNHITNSSYFVLIRYFLAGSVLWLWKKYITYTWKLCLLAIIFLILAEPLHLLDTAFVFFGAYLTIFFAQGNRFANFGKLGDASYGIYIWGFLIQQCVRATLPTLLPLENFFISLPIAIIVGYISWHTIEKNALKFKHNRKSITSTPNKSI